jgi:peptidoglycan/LPS O-acetylase OafA/YrhL
VEKYDLPRAQNLTLDSPAPCNQVQDKNTQKFYSVSRNANLDLLRAIAIALVVAYHIVQNAPVAQPWLMKVAVFGQYGVDLFFVLSGWLIGRLYWKERARFGDVDLLRFWARRWLRTIPPYLIALALAWVAVLTERGQSFNLGYLVFIQNYYQTIPFFVVSWSLCIEEHFYLIVPLLLVWGASSKRSVFLLFTTLILIAPISRAFVSDHRAVAEFMYTHTATHFRMEGLLVGFLVAYLPDYSGASMVWLQKRSFWLLGFSIAALAAFACLPPLWQYRFGFTVLPLGFVTLLIWLVGRKPGALASSLVIQWLAVSSYSVYLTHALVIHLARRLIGMAPGALWPLYFPVVLILIGAVGLGFYLGFERTSIYLRDRWISRRQYSPEISSFGLNGTKDQIEFAVSGLSPGVKFDS